MTEQELLQDCLRRLNDSFIEYMLVGSMASNYWGIPRSTHDIDFVIQYSDADISQIVQLFDGDFFIQEISVRAALKRPISSMLSIAVMQLPTELTIHPPP